MINVADITESLKTVLSEAPTLSDVKAVERGEYVNKDAARTPWVGVYRTNAEYEPRALGNHSKSWGAKITIKLVLQVYNANGEKAEDELEDLLHRVMAVVFGDLTIRQNVSMLNSVKIQYSYDETDSDTMDYQWAFITLIYEARTGA
jgi:hypothetical protein